MAVSRMICSTGKKIPKSRSGLCHNWILLMHSNVPWILAMPAMKQTGSKTAMFVVRMVMKLQRPMTTAAPQSSCWFVKRNFIRNSIGNHTAMPARPVYRHISKSSSISPVVPRTASNAPKYTPPENWIQSTCSTYIHG